MATTSTYGLDLTSAAWTLIADGAAYATAYIEAGGPNASKIAVATSSPSTTTDDWFPLAEGQSITIPLGTGDQVYGMSLPAASYVRGYLVSI